MTLLRDKLSAGGIRLPAYGEGNHKTTCPQCSRQRHNKFDPCLSVKIDERGAAWNCHHCGWSGGVIEDSYRRQRQVKRQPHAKPTRELRPLTAEQIAWFGQRDITPETLTAAKVGSAAVFIPGAGRECEAVAFPYFRNGECVNVKFRTTADKMFAQVKGAEKILYGIERTDPTVSDLVIVEGELDALACLESRIANAVSVPDGAPKHVKDGEIDPADDRKFDYLRNCEAELTSFKRFILATDGDEPGHALAEELARRLGREKCSLVEWPEGCKDANDVLMKLGPDDLAAVIQSARPYPIKSVYGVEHYKDAVFELYREGQKRGLSSGWKALDGLYTVSPGELTVVTGIPNSGKSEWVDALAVNLAHQHDWRFGMCSFENQPPQHLSKLAEKYLLAPFWEGPTPRMDEWNLLRALDWLGERFFFIRAEDESPTIEWVLEAAKALVLRHGIRGLVIDPFNELEHKRPSGMSETEYVSGMLSQVKRFAQNSGVHVWFIAHPKKMERDANGKPIQPGLYDISGSAHWANKADMGISIARDDERRCTEISVLKVRFKERGAKGTARLAYDRPTGCYYDQDGGLKAAQGRSPAERAA